MRSFGVLFVLLLLMFFCFVVEQGLVLWASSCCGFWAESSDQSRRHEGVRFVKFFPMA